MTILEQRPYRNYIFSQSLSLWTLTDSLSHSQESVTLTLVPAAALCSGAWRTTSGVPRAPVTVTVPPAGWVRFLPRFENFAGTFVFHCHTLAHEDLGMMQLFQVTPRPA